MKKIMVMSMFFVFLIAGILSNYVQGLNQEVRVILDDEALVFDEKPLIIDGRTMVPLRAIFEALAMDVSWDNRLQEVTAVKDNLEIILLVGSKTPTVNGEVVEIDVVSYIENGRTMVPLRFIAESTGATVEWDGKTNTVTITSPIDAVGISDLVLSYPIVDTGVSKFHTDDALVSDLSETEAFYGQDASYDGNQPSYTDNGDGTVTDMVTGLMWQQTMDEKMTYEEAVEYAENANLAGYGDWRIPSIKALFSLIQYTGESGGETAKVLFIDDSVFDQPIGDTSVGEREIDAQTWSSTQYVSTTMNGDATVFGVNFIDGRIKGYPILQKKSGDENTGYFRLVRGNEAYGENLYIDNGDGTISDLATGLMWQMSDDGETRDWQEALEYSENLELANYDDWRLPNIKELQSIVDYTRSLDTTDSPAIDPLFVLTEMTDPEGALNYGFYWSSTSHQDGNNISKNASYVAFGEAQGEMFGDLLDVHGCGAVRSDPKSGDESAYPSYFGPQGDVRYVYNYVLAVRTIEE